MIFRNFLEKISRNIVLKRKMPKDFGSRIIYVSPEGGLRYWKPKLDTIDTMLLNFANHYVKEGGTVWDIGANLGFFTLAAAEKVGSTGQIYSFEADIYMANLLKKTARKNLDRKIDVFPIAIASQQGLAKFNIAKRARSTNFLEMGMGSTQTGGVRESYNVLTINMNELSKFVPLPNIIKIDVEGAEQFLFEGAANFFDQVRPVILCELSPSTFPFIHDFLNERDYLFYDGQCIPLLKDFDITKSENLLAIPK